MRFGLRLLCLAIALSVCVPTASALTLERELRLDPNRVRVRTAQGVTAVEAVGGTHEFTSGRPDLPWISERVDLPAGTRLTRVEVLAVETERMGAGLRLATARVARPGAAPGERTPEDATLYAKSGFQPEVLALPGVQGSLRGRQVAYLRIAPARWDARTGQLERVTRLKLRLTVEDGAAPAVTRERIVREWEDELPSGIPSRAIVSLQSSAVAGEAGVRPKAEPFKPLQVPSVLGSPVEYLIVTNDAMAPVFQQLADWKTQTGVPAVVRTVSFIHQQYPFGTDDAERIRMFIRDAYARWGTKWVLLGGDTDVVPERQALNVSFYQVENIATDLYYQCLDGNWNGNGNSDYGEGFQDEFTTGDEADFLPELYVGRATVSTPLEAQTFVNKTLQYTKTPLGGYEDRWLLFAEVLFPQPYDGGPIDLDGASLAEDIPPLADANPGLSLTRLYENYTEPSYRPGALPENKNAVLAQLSTGYGLALHIGHGYRNSMSLADASMVNSDASGLTNGNKLFNMYAINCTSSAIDFPCIGEALLKNPNGGAVTVVGSTRFDFPTAGRAYQQEYFRLFFQDSVSAVGELLARQKLPFVAFTFYDGVNRWTHLTLLELGDPELRMYNGAWRSLAVTGPPSFTLGDSVASVHVTSGGNPVANARVTLYKAGDEFRTGLTNGSGNIQLPFRPDDTGPFFLTVTAYNAKPYQTTLQVTAASAAAVSEGAITVDDDNVGGTIGNGDGFADAGETVDLRVALRNRGSAGTSGGVQGTLTSSDAFVGISNANGAWNAIAAGATGDPVTPFRLLVPANVPDQREVAFALALWDGSRSWRESLALTVRAPELTHAGHQITESPGNNNGRPTTGETASYTVRVRNNGSGIGKSVTAKLRCLNGLATVTDSTSVVGNVATGATVLGDPFVFTVNGEGAQFQVEIRDAMQVRLLQTVDLEFPSVPFDLAGLGEADAVKLTWQPNFEEDLAGYNIYRATAAAGPYTKVNPLPTDRTAYFHDEGLAPLTQFFYRCAAVDSSGNESTQTLPVGVSTNPPLHTIFPVPTGGTTPSSVALEFAYSSEYATIAAGSDVLYVLNADASAPVDADGEGQTLGDFTSRGFYYAAGPSMSVLAPGEGMSFIAPAWGQDAPAPPDSAGLYVFDRDGNTRPGFPLYTGVNIWSSAVVTDLDGDNHMEMALGSNGNRFYVMRANGQEWMDGDSNPATKGVFKVLPASFNIGSPAAADIDLDGLPELVYGGIDGRLYVWNGDGTNVPGFPFVAPSSPSGSPEITSSAAIGYLDGPGDSSPEIVFTSMNDSLYVLNANGTRRPGWPVWTRVRGSSRAPSPALADINNDTFLDIVHMGINGGVYVYNRNGSILVPWSNVRYSLFTSGASESSPVVADINGDGFNDIVCGGEDGRLAALSGATATMLPGFPIQLGAEVRGTPAVGDIDLDGKTEIVLAGWDKNIYVWDYDFTFSPGKTPPWPQFHHDARRTGYAHSPLFLGVEDDGDGGSGSVSQLEFAPPSPNPSRTALGTRFRFAVPADLGGQRYELAIYDLSGRRVQLVDVGEAKAGRYSLTWNLRDSHGRPVDGGVYFARFSLAGRHLTRKIVVLQ